MPASTSRWSRYPGLFRCSALILGGVLVWFGTLGWPIPMGDGLDASWNYVLGYARLHHLQFGREIVFTYGPWGYLTMPYTLPELFWDRVAWEFVFKAGLAVSIAFCAARLPWWRALLLVAFSALMLSMFGDASYSFVLALLIWSNAVAQSPDRRLAPIASGAVLGFFALQKFTFFVFTGAGIAGACTVLLARRQRRVAICLGGAWLVSAVASWLAAAQSLSTFGSFLARSLAQSAAYQGSMVFDESAGVFWCGLATLGASAVTIILVARQFHDWPTRARALLVVLGLGLCFLVWKQSFIRADGHVMGLFLFAAAAGLAVRHLSGVLVAAIATFGFWTAEPGLMGYAHNFFRYHVEEDLTKLRALSAVHAQFVAQTVASKETRQLPAIRARIGDRSVDVFGYEQVVAYWNDLPFRPRPAFQSYQVTTPSLTQLNADFYASPHAPAFVLAKLDSIDGRYPPMDDARALRALIAHYEFDEEEQGWLLLRRRAYPRVASTSVLTLRARIGDAITLPTKQGDLVWAEIDLRPSWLGELRTFAYKPRMAALNVSTGATAQTYRIVAEAARGGFYLSPALTSTADLRAVLTDSSAPATTAITVDIAPEYRKYFRPSVGVTLQP